MEENRYKIEKIEKDISDHKEAQVTHTANCAAYALVTAFISTLSLLSHNITTDIVGLTVGGAIASLSILELININKRKKILNDLINLKEQLLKNEEEKEEEQNRSK